MTAINGWHDVLKGIDSTVLDCVYVNLAVLADTHHGAGTYLRLGSAPRFSWVARPDGLPTVEPTLGQRLERVPDALGLSVSARWSNVAAASLLAIARDCRPDALLVVGDAAALAWTPYYGQQSVEHSFLLSSPAPSDEFWLVDAYHNDTQWGPARPAATRLDGRALRQALGSAAFDVLRLEPAALPPISARSALAATREHFEAPDMEPATRGYVQAYRDSPQPRALAQLTLETWLLARERQSHARWLAGAGPRVPPAVRRSAELHASSWSGLAEHVYIGLHRARRGRPAPPDLYDRLADLLRRDAVLAGQLDPA